MPAPISSRPVLAARPGRVARRPAAPGPGTLRALLAGLAAALLATGPAAAQGPAGAPAAPRPAATASAPPAAVDAAEDARRARALARASAAVVGLRSTAVEDAVSNRTLGRAREGSGVLIDPAGLVLTIGYLVLEAEQVELELDDGRRLPARPLAYDQATGFGLVQSLVPLPMEAVPLGRSGTLRTDEPLMVVSGGGGGDLGLAQLMSRRPFSGYWEYHLDEALFTAPPHDAHSGAGLFNADGELLGIGSLVVSDARGPGQPPQVGNMFVPIDLLAPILPELRSRGSSRGSHRAWLGLQCVEQGGAVRVVRVNEDGPAEAAGLRPGDLIAAIDGRPVAGLEAFYKALWTGAAERDVQLDIRRRGAEERITVRAMDRLDALRRPQGI
ncbi:S1C family serine protease [Piscinibacter sakaiensis]|uniref:Putative serine protease n=1 Tax=Piscinibacter sakaiensis TaxID=1547922 RepID=A0A0K8P9X5_PISS1|nr:S1C family serine protease [Piscinibacter sakaiensis]GAP38965.1 putative serine protease [Piscinibacter sakaiensis]